ncbi:MAG: DNA methyltransferase, partial [Nanoarchaeota archaeon]
MKQIDDKSIDLIVTDPPYNTGMNSINTSSLNHPTVRFNSSPTWLGNFFNDSYSDEEYLNLIQKCCKEFYRILKNN